MANTTPVARVSAIEGQAFAKGENGELRVLHVGDVIFEGDVLVTAAGSRVELAAEDGRTLVLGANETVTVDAEVMASLPPDATDSALQLAGADVDKVVKAINEGGSLDDLLEEPAAGDAGGGADGGPSFVRLLRITEGVDPLGFGFDATQRSFADDDAQSSALGNSPLGGQVAPVNDAAVISAPVVDLTETDVVLTTSGTLTITDVDSATTFTALTNVAGSNGYGTFTVGTDGAWTYTANTAHNEFVAGQTYTDTVTVTSADGTTSTITVNILGTNDAAVISAPVVDLTETDAVLTTSGTLTITDVDSATTFTALTNVAGSNGYGTFTVGTDGAWTYTANTAHNEFVAGQTYTDTVTVTSADGTTSTITINILGTNDAAVITSLGTPDVSVVEAGGGLFNPTFGDPIAHGQLSVTDADAGEAHFHAPTASALVGQYGFFLFNANNGQWAYVLNNLDRDTQALNAGERVTDTLTVTSHDGTTHDIVVNITGANDNALIRVSGPQDLNVREAGGVNNAAVNDPYASGTLVVSDVDAGQARFQIPSTLFGTYGTFTFDVATGKWGYQLNNDLVTTQALKQGDHAHDTLTVNSLDGTATHNIVVTINGTNDAPTTTPVTLTAIAEDSGDRIITQAELLSNANDVDDAKSELHATNLTIATGLGTLTDNGNGTWTYHPGANDDGSVSFNYTITDNVSPTAGTISGSATLDITPVNDAPTTAPVVLTAIAEDSGDRIITQAELLGNTGDIEGDTLTVSGLSIASGNGTLTDNGDGTWTYTPALNDDTSVSFNYTITDNGTTNGVADLLTVSGSATLDITPVNDAPTTSPVVLTAIAEDSGDRIITQAELLGDASDVDNAKSELSATNLTIATGLGTLTDNHNGTWTYTPALNDDTSVSFSYTVTDNLNPTAGTVTGSATLDLTPVNDAPVLDLDADNSHNIVTIQSIVGLFNTGVDASGTALAAGANDPHYDILTQPALGTVSDTVTAHSAWSQNSVNSAWIGSGASGPNQPTGLYEYQTKFTLQEGADPKSVLIGMNIYSDNYLRDILVNGVSTGIASTLGYNTLTSIQLSGGTAAFHSGDNTITFVVENRDTSGPTTAGPTGLRIDNLTSSVAVTGPDLVNHQTDYATIYVEGTPVSISDADGRITDVDNTTLQGATITLSNAQLGDLLLASGMPAGISAVVNQAGTVVTLTGDASLAAYETAIHAVQFSNTSHAPAGSDRTITVVVNDGALSSNIGTTTVHVVPVGDAPVLDLDADNSTAIGFDYATSFSRNGALTAIVDSDTTIKDSDSITIRSATIHLTDAQVGDILNVGTLPRGLRASLYDPINAVVTITGDATLADYQTALRSVTFNTSTDISQVSYRHIDVTVNDGLANSNVAHTTITVGTQVTTTLAETTAPVPTAASGLLAEYYGYNDRTTDSSYKTHTDDGNFGNLDSIADMQAIINGRNGNAIVGSIVAAGPGVADGVFHATDLNYGQISSDLGNNASINSGNLVNFLHAHDANSLTGDVGHTTDAGIRFIGFLDSPAGSYDIRIFSDDGFRLMVGGEQVAAFDSIRSPGNSWITNVSLNGGLTPIEILYWDQAGNAVLNIQFKPAGADDSAYVDIGRGDLALLAPDFASYHPDTLTSLQDIVADPNHPGQFLIRTGQEYTGTSGNDQITGSAGRDILHGGAGNDTLNGGANDDTLHGGRGNDSLTGAAGSDVFVWHFGDQGTVANAARDVITDFSLSTAGGSRDVLDLKDLLVGESHTAIAGQPGNLASYLHFSYNATTHDTTVDVRTHVSGSSVDQVIVFQGVDLTSGGTLNTDQLIIQDLLAKGKLVTD